MISEVSLTQHDKDGVLSERKNLHEYLVRKQNELFKVNVQLREDYLRPRWKWTQKMLGKEKLWHCST